MKNYKFKFSKIITIVGIVGIILAIVCMVAGVLRFINLNNQNIQITLYQYISFALTIILPIAYMVIAISAYFNSYYFVTDKEVVLKWGVIANKFNLSDIKEVKLLTNDKKLELVFSDDSYFLVATDPKWYDDFVDEIKAKKPNISYIIITEPTKD